MADEHSEIKAPGSPAVSKGEGSGEISVTRIEVLNLVFVSVAALIVYFFRSPNVALGVIAGGSLTAASFRIIAMAMRALFVQTSSKFWPVVTYWLKYGFMMGSVGVLVLVYKVDVYGLLLGLSLILPAIMLETFIKLFR